MYGSVEVSGIQLMHVVEQTHPVRPRLPPEFHVLTTEEMDQAIHFSENGVSFPLPLP